MDVHVKNSSAWTEMTTDWVVPELPTSAGEQVVYFWPGFKATAPEMGYPVLQPVMQYGQDGKHSWQLQSWFVHGDANVAVTGPAVDLSPGDKITSSMKYDASAKTWLVSGTNLRTGKTSDLKISRSRLGGYDFDWAMLVCETVKFDDDCAALPAQSSLSFTNVTLNGFKSIEWKERVGLKDCDQNIRAGSENVSLVWSYGQQRR